MNTSTVRVPMRCSLVLLIVMTAFSSAAASLPTVHYTVSMSRPSSHLFEVEVTVDRVTGDALELHMPAWRTGRYVLLDFSGGVQEFSAVGENGAPLPFRKTDKDTWRIERTGTKRITARYKVFANEFNMRTRELNDEHAFIDPLAVFMYVKERQKEPVELTVVPYGDWFVTTGLDEVKGKKNVFTAPDFETFGDCPLEIGRQTVADFFVEGTKHTICIYGAGTWVMDSLIQDLTKIVIANKEFWGSFPYDRFIFMIHCQPNAGGGTEHLNSTIMGIRPFVFSTPAGYHGFLSLVSHEYFHTWNVKQLRPRAIAPYDFSKEAYTEELWVSEGTTSYCDDLILLHTGHTDAKSYIDVIAGMVNNERNRYGNSVQPLAESSFDAWVKFWRGRQNAQNAESDYYGKGSQVSLLLDVELRHRTGNRISLQDVLKEMLRRFPRSKGFTNADLLTVFNELSGSDFGPLFHHFLYTIQPLPWESILLHAGLEVAVKDSAKKNALGIASVDAGDKVRITNVTPGSPAADAGLDYNDEIVALNGYRVRSAEISERIAALPAGDTATVTFFRNDRLREVKIPLRSFGIPTYTVRKLAKPTEQQKALFESWLKTRWDGQ